MELGSNWILKLDQNLGLPDSFTRVRTNINKIVSVFIYITSCHLNHITIVSDTAYLILPRTEIRRICKKKFSIQGNNIRNKKYKK